jgi:hypothetical protein
MKPFPLTAYLFGMVGPSSFKFRDGRGGLGAAMVVYWFLQSAAIIDFCIFMPIAIMQAAFKKVASLR